MIAVLANKIFVFEIMIYNIRFIKINFSVVLHWSSNKKHITYVHLFVKLAISEAEYQFHLSQDFAISITWSLGQ